MEILDIHLEGYNIFLLCVELAFSMQPIVWQTKLWHLPYLYSKVSNNVFNIWLVTHINLYFILLILMMDQTWSGNQVEYHTTQNCLEFHQDADHARILNRRRSVSGIIHTLLGAAVCWKVQIQPAIASFIFLSFDPVTVTR